MTKSTAEFHDYVLNDVLGGIEGITSKRMFGGYGFYLDGNVFAFIVEDELYFKVDENNKPDYESRGSHPFVYTGHKNKGPVEMPYWLLPEEIMNDPETLYDWVVTSAEISKNSKKKK